jgi:hypothetical protein
MSAFIPDLTSNLRLARLEPIRTPLFKRTDKAIPASRHRLYKPGVLRGVSQNLANLIHRGIEVVLKINERVGPSFLQLLPGDDLAGTLQQYGQDLEWLAAQPELDPTLTKFSCAKINFKHPEANGARRLNGIFHV